MIHTIQKKGQGFVNNLLTDAENYFLYFNQNMDSKNRTLLVATLILMDMMFFSDRSNQGAGLVYD